MNKVFVRGNIITRGKIEDAYITAYAIEEDVPNAIIVDHDIDMGDDDFIIPSETIFYASGEVSAGK